MSAPSATLTGVCKAFGGRRVLDSVSLSLAPGTCYGLVGPNGTGKTTTLRIMLGLVRPDAGTAHVFGLPYRHLPDAARRVGASLDPRSVPRDVSAKTWLRYRGRLVGLSAAQADAALDRAGLTDSADRRCTSLSMGQHQRLAVAIALLADPDLVVLDEPTVGLDIDGVDWLRGTVRDIVARGGTVVMSSHDLGELAETADRVIVMDRGRVLSDEPTRLLMVSDTVRVDATDRVLLDHVLTQAGYVATPTPTGARDVRGVAADRLGPMLISRGVLLTELSSAPGDLRMGVTRRREEARSDDPAYV